MSEGKSQTTKFGPDILTSDHLRNCQGREYQCSCGYDEAKDGEIKRLRTALLRIAERGDTRWTVVVALEALKND